MVAFIMSEKQNYNRRTTIRGTERFLPLLLKESECFASEGSVDTLAQYVIGTLSSIKTSTGKTIGINLWESIGTSGKLASALTREGITDFFSRGLITTNRTSVTKLFDEMNLIYDTFKPNTKETALASAVLINNKRQEEISLVTTGNILGKGSDVHIAIMIRGEDPNVLTVTNEYFENAMRYYEIDLKNTTLNSAKKQFVTHQAFLFLLHKLRGIKEQIPFKLRENSETFSKYDARLMRELISKLEELNLVLGLSESALGGLLTDKLTDYTGGDQRLCRGDVLYNEVAKKEAGVQPFAFNEFNVYSDAAATELARVANKDDVDVAIGITGLLNTPDTRTDEHEVGDFYYSIQVRDKKEHKKSKPYRLKVRTRLEMKEMSALIVYRHLLHILTSDKK